MCIPLAQRLKVKTNAGSTALFSVPSGKKHGSFNEKSK